MIDLLIKHFKRLEANQARRRGVKRFLKKHGVTRKVPINSFGRTIGFAYRPRNYKHYKFYGQI